MLQKEEKEEEESAAATEKETESRPLRVESVAYYSRQSDECCASGCGPETLGDWHLIIDLLIGALIYSFVFSIVALLDAAFDYFWATQADDIRKSTAFALLKLAFSCFLLLATALSVGARLCTQDASEKARGVQRATHGALVLDLCVGALVYVFVFSLIALADAVFNYRWTAVGASTILMDVVVGVSSLNASGERLVPSLSATVSLPEDILKRANAFALLKAAISTALLFAAAGAVALRLCVRRNERRKLRRPHQAFFSVPR